MYHFLGRAVTWLELQFMAKRFNVRCMDDNREVLLLKETLDHHTKERKKKPRSIQ